MAKTVKTKQANAARSSAIQSSGKQLRKKSVDRPVSKAVKRKSVKHTDERTVISLDFQHDDLMHSMTRSTAVETNVCDDIDGEEVSKPMTMEEKQVQFESDAKRLDETLEMFNNMR